MGSKRKTMLVEQINGQSGDIAKLPVELMCSSSFSASLQEYHATCVHHDSWERCCSCWKQCVLQGMDRFLLPTNSNESHFTNSLSWRAAATLYSLISSPRQFHAYKGPSLQSSLHCISTEQHKLTHCQFPFLVWFWLLQWLRRWPW